MHSFISSKVFVIISTNYKKKKTQNKQQKENNQPPTHKLFHFQKYRLKVLPPEVLDHDPD